MRAAFFDCFHQEPEVERNFSAVDVSARLTGELACGSRASEKPDEVTEASILHMSFDFLFPVLQ